MIEIKCDSCDAVRRPNQEIRNGDGWIMGWDLLTESSYAVQRSIRFLDHWDDRRIAELGAIHFCSVECKDDYLKGSRVAA
jgi:hypothetical protein